MHYAFDLYGWYTGEVPDGTKRSTPLVPPSTSTTETPGEDRANWTGRAWVLRSYSAPPSDPPPPAPAPPNEVTMAQARIALSRAGISTTAIEALFDAMPLGQAKVEARIWWESSSTVQRSHAVVNALAPALGLDSAALDALFTAAAAIKGS